MLPEIGTRPPSKILYVETLRGIACLLLVSYHVIGNTSLNGLQLPPEHIYSFLNRMFVDVRMPLFSFISGFVFNCYARDSAALGGKISSKARRLLLPMIVVGSLHYWTQYLVVPLDRDHLSYIEIFFLPYEHFWYLQATFVLMAVSYLLSFAMKGDGVRTMSLLWLPCIIGYVFVTRWSPDVFSAYKALYLAPYFIAGYLLGHAPAAITRMAILSKLPAARALAAILLLALFSIEFLLLTDAVTFNEPTKRAFGFLVGLSACGSFFLWRIKSRALAFIGDKSYAIFLLHVFFTAGSRIVLLKLAPALSVDVLFLVGVLSGVFGPIGIYWLALKHPVPALLLFGVWRRPVLGHADQPPTPASKQPAT
ncbi:MAG: acyltransferase [Rhodospirillaceae bacterium]|nr:acyltransferase [Rhodospirillaceae bacterium]